ncbi:MAG TPA: CpsB/CapC family capsule biosynthesis tyrosine phosphatase [Thermoleophilaceae bacterium]
MIDLHSHVLPGIDDGPSTIEESLEFMRVAAGQGTTVLAATPHLRSDFPDVQVEHVAESCAELNRLADGGAVPTVTPGGEVDLVWAQKASDEQLRLASFGQRGSDLLVETPYGILPENFEELIYHLSLRGYRILLAHPERNPTFHSDPKRLKDLARRGVLLQITLPSVASRKRGSHSRALALELVREGLAHNLASDSHSPGSFRPPSLRLGVQAVSEVSPAYAEWMVTDAAAAILEGEPLPAAPQVNGSRRGLRLPIRLRR